MHMNLHKTVQHDEVTLVLLFQTNPWSTLWPSSRLSGTCTRQNRTSIFRSPRFWSSRFGIDINSSNKKAISSELKFCSKVLGSTIPRSLLRPTTNFSLRARPLLRSKPLLRSPRAVITKRQKCCRRRRATSPSAPPTTKTRTDIPLDRSRNKFHISTGRSLLSLKLTMTILLSASCGQIL